MRYVLAVLLLVAVSVYEVFTTTWTKGSWLLLPVIFLLFIALGDLLLGRRVADLRLRVPLLISLFVLCALLHLGADRFLLGHTDRHSYLKTAGNCPAPVLTPLSVLAARVSTYAKELREAWEDVCRTSDLGHQLQEMPETLCPDPLSLFACYRGILNDMGEQAPLSDMGKLLMMAVGVVAISKDARQGADRGGFVPELALIGQLDIVEMSLLLGAPSSNPVGLFAFLKTQGANPSRDMMKNAVATLAEAETQLNTIKKTRPEVAAKHESRYRALKARSSAER